ncbi:MAG TPA: hypothetical protein PKD12_10485 [Nitrospira sp.]|nr:hypothetical protein [Nitrospira sp.]
MVPLHAGTTARLILYSGMVLLSPLNPSVSLAEDSSEPKSIRMTCGKCPEGYATTGVTASQDICKDHDGVLVQCVPLGANILGICGVCPEGYAEIGSSSVPARCGNSDGGRLTQCQLRKMETTFPDATQGYKTCPPDCGSAAQPGQGAIPPPPRYHQVPDHK